MYACMQVVCVCVLCVGASSYIMFRFFVVYVDGIDGRNSRLP